MPFTARDLSISADGDVLIQPRTAVPPEPLVEVVSRLLRELVELVDDPTPALTAYTATASSYGPASAASLIDLARGLERAFGVSDSREVLRPIAERMDPSVLPDNLVVVFVPDDIDVTDFPLEASSAAGKGAAPKRARATRRVATTMVCAAIGLVAIGLAERTRKDTTDPAQRTPSECAPSAHPRRAPSLLNQRFLLRLLQVSRPERRQ